jgi:hypothetical protein
MQSLLRWGVENSTQSTGLPPTTTNKLDPGIIDHILGKPDAQLMREALIIGIDERQTEDDRLQALDDLEMVRSMIEHHVWLLTIEYSWLRTSIMRMVIILTRFP